MIHILAAGYPPTSPYPPDTSGGVRVAEIGIIVFFAVGLLLRVLGKMGGGYSSKQNRRR